MTTLSTLVAVKVAGYKRHEVPVPPEMAALGHTEPAVYFSIHGKAHVPPDYADSADAVLLLLDNEYAWSCMKNTVRRETTCTRSVYITVRTPDAPDPVQVFHGEARTFEEAACRALCLAHGCTQIEIDAALIS